MSSQEQTHSLEEDATKVTEAASRKKLQNKLNQRALRTLIECKNYSCSTKLTIYRYVVGARNRDRKKALAILQRQESRNTTGTIGSGRRYALILPRSDQQWQQLPQPRGLSEAVEMMARFDVVAYERYYAADPCVDHLLTLTKFNVLRALLGNLAALGLSIQMVEDDGYGALSPFNSTTNPSSIGHHSYHRRDRNILPASLLPTTTQLSIPHHPWLDCFPYPRMRDNIINAPEGFDDCELCTDMMDPANGDIGLMVWGDPWLPQNWEVSEFFVQKWPWVIEGCSEILVHSNYWRAKRGLKGFRISHR